ncbi:spore germination protein [Gracilibacillus ureilyticus]|nr:spore germination protein [Gracilibacillus ureilyticus]
MVRRKRVSQRSEGRLETEEKTISEVFEKANKSSDFTTITPLETDPSLVISFYQTLIEPKIIQNSVLPFLKEDVSKIRDLAELKNIIPVEGIHMIKDPGEIERKLHDGSAVIYYSNNQEKFAIVDIGNSRLGQRETNETENEFSVIGPKVGFIEDINTNLHLLRDHLNTSDLIFEESLVGSRTKTKVVLAYLDGVTNPEYVNTVNQRIKELDIDATFDNTQIEQLIADKSTTPFPLFISTERVDRTVGALVQGNIVLLSDKSSYAVIGPASLMDFFSNPEDFYLPSIIASFFKLIRIFGMLFSIFATSFYVAILTFHYEVVPKDLLGPIIFSRANVPFPPVIEVLFLEITIDLLREAGARLPTKIGQTLGIVGGIVIGQATVEAALTSNILLIVVALAALSSFTTPIYKMSNAVRLLRYPFILLASVWGGLGIYAGLTILIAHLARLKSLGVPFLLPIYPFRKGGIASAFIRPNYMKSNNRPWYLRVLSVKKYSPVSNKDTDKGLNSE